MNTLTRGGPGIPFILTSLVFHGLNTFLVFFLSLEILRHACKASLFAPGRSGARRWACAQMRSTCAASAS